MIFRLFMVALALASAGTASAQRRTVLGREVSTAEAARTLHDFSRCAVRRWPDRAREILALDFNSEEYRDRIRMFAWSVPQCAPRGRLAFSTLPFAGDMAEALLADDPADLASKVGFDPARPSLAARSETEAMALCVVRAAPREVSALLATRVFSVEEAAVLRELTPDVQACLAAGVSLTLNRINLRSMLALAAYRLVEHNRAPLATRAL